MSQDFDGEAEFNVPMDEIKKKLEWHADQYYPTQIKVIVKVTDKNSQIELNGMLFCWISIRS